MWCTVPYSLLSTPDRADAYEISVLHVEQSRGGSEYMHTRVAAGSELWITPPGNLFPVHQLARKHILIAGGIGITPFMAMTAQLSNLGHPFELHYSIRNDSAGAYGTALQESYGNAVTVYRTDLGELLPLGELLEDQPLGTHLYVWTGRDDLWALESGRRAGWPEENLHCERFLAPPAGHPFTVTLARSQREVAVGEHESILEAIEAAGLEPPYLCRGGACGQCETRVLASCTGRPRSSGWRSTTRTRCAPDLGEDQSPDDGFGRRVWCGLRHLTGGRTPSPDGWPKTTGRPSLVHRPGSAASVRTSRCLRWR